MTSPRSTLTAWPVMLLREIRREKEIEAGHIVGLHETGQRLAGEDLVEHLVLADLRARTETSVSERKAARVLTQPGQTALTRMLRGPKFLGEHAHEAEIAVLRGDIGGKFRRPRSSTRSRR